MSDINKALITANGPSLWEQFCSSESEPNACIHCAWGNCSHSGTTRVKTKKGHRDVNHKTGLSKDQFNRWLSAQKAPAKTVPVSTAPVASTSGAPADKSLHSLNEITGFNSLSQPVKERISNEVKAEAKVSSWSIGPITGWDDAAWAVVEPIAIRKVLEELAKRSAPRPHHKAGGHPHHKGKGGRR